MLNLTVKIRRRIFLDYRLTLSYILESNLILWFRIREWNHAFGKKYMSKKKEGKRKENDPVLFFRVNLPETKTELCHSSPLQLGSSQLSSLCFMTFLFLEPKLRVTSSLWNMFLIGISNMLIPLADIFFKLRRAYAALYCGPIVSQSFSDKIWRMKNCVKVLIYV